MQKAFTALAMWIVVFVAGMAAMFGFLLPAVFNMNSNLMFPTMVGLLVIAALFGFWTMRRVVWAFRRFSQWSA